MKYENWWQKRFLCLVLKCSNMVITKCIFCFTVLPHCFLDHKLTEYFVAEHLQYVNKWNAKVTIGAWMELYSVLSVIANVCHSLLSSLFLSLEWKLLCVVLFELCKRAKSIVGGLWWGTAIFKQCFCLAQYYVMLHI